MFNEFFSADFPFISFAILPAVVVPFFMKRKMMEVAMKTDVQIFRLKIYEEINLCRIFSNLTIH